MIPPILIFAIGNESRGDDALAPLLLRRLQAQHPPGVELIEEFQLQVEHVTDLAGRALVLFVDTDVSCTAPFHFSPVTAMHDNSYTSHAMSPAALLLAFLHVYGDEPPPSCLLRIRGYSFGLGEEISDEATSNLESAIKKVLQWLADNPPPK